MDTERPRRKYVPRAFAPSAMNFLANTPRCALWASCGMGKTTLVANYLDILYNVAGEDAPTLILAPLRVARDGWPEEPKKWQHLSGFDVTPMTGNAEERAAALRLDRPVFSLNYENLPWLLETLKLTGRAWPFRTVIADEATKLKGFRIKQGGVQAGALGKAIHNDVERVVELTGTPSPNGLKDLWGQIWFLDGGQRLGRTYKAFEERWFGYRRVTDAISHKVGIVPVIFPYAEDQIHGALKDICLTLDPKDWFDLADPIVSVIEVELPTKARAKYRELERELFVQLDALRNAEVFNAADLTNKCLQLANGAVYPSDGATGANREYVEVHAEKLDALQERIDETGDEPLLVAYKFKSDLARLKRAFPYAIDLSFREGMAAAMRGEGKLWLGHPKGMGHGVDGLQEHCNRIVFFSQDWNLEEHDQMLERVGPMRQLQAGKTCGVFVDYLVARRTVDEVVMARRGSKRSVQEALMAYMKGAK